MQASNVEQLLLPYRMEPMTPLRSDSRSLRVLATEAIRQLIVDRSLESGDRIPGEQELVTLLGTSRSTVREALKSLEHEGLLVSRQGAGTFVAAAPILSFDLTDIDFLRHTEELLAGRGLHEEFPYTFIGEGVADTVTARHLGLKSGSPIVVAERIRTVDGDPIGHFRTEIAPAPELLNLLTEARPASIREFISELRGIRIDHAVSEIRAVGLPESIASLLSVPSGHASLEMQQLRKDEDGDVVYLTRSYWLTDRISFRLVRRPAEGRSVR